MNRHVAFLRGINLGKRRVKMDRLRRFFEELGFGNVATFIASGNVVFDFPVSDRRKLEQEIETHLEEALGFTTETFVRPLEELDQLTKLKRVRTRQEEGFTPHVIFLREEADDRMEGGLRTLETEDDRFLVLSTEVVWFRRGGLTESPIKTRDLETVLGGRKNTTRNLKTLQRMVAKFGV